MKYLVQALNYTTISFCAIWYSAFASNRELSGNRYARAQRSLGKYWFLKRDLEKAVDSYEKAVKINPMFENSWFTLGKNRIRPIGSC